MRATNFWLHAFLINSLVFVAACGGGGGSDNEAERPSQIAGTKKEVIFKAENVEAISKTTLDIRDFIYHTMATRIFGYWDENGGTAVCINRSAVLEEDRGSAELIGVIGADGQTTGTVTLRFINCKMQYFIDDTNFFVKNSVLPIVTLNGDIPVKITKSPDETGATKYYVDMEFNDFSWSADEGLVPPLFYCDDEKNAYFEEYDIAHDEDFEVEPPPDPEQNRVEYEEMANAYNLARDTGSVSELFADDWDNDTDITSGGKPAKRALYEIAKEKVSRHYRETYSIGGEMRITYKGNVLADTGKMTAAAQGDLSFRHVSGETVNFQDFSINADITGDDNSPFDQRYTRTLSSGTLAYESQQTMSYLSSLTGPTILTGSNGFIEIRSSRLLYFDEGAIPYDDIPTSASDEFYIELTTNAFGDLRYIRVPEDDLGNLVPSEEPSACEPAISIALRQQQNAFGDMEFTYNADGTITENSVRTTRLDQRRPISTTKLNTYDPDHDYFKFTWDTSVLPADNLINDSRGDNGDYLFLPVDETNNDAAGMQFTSFIAGSFTLTLTLENPELEGTAKSEDFPIEILLEPAKFDVSGVTNVESGTTQSFNITPAADAKGNISFELVGAPEGATMIVQNNNYSVQWVVGELPFGEASFASLTIKSFNEDSEYVQTFPIKVRDQLDRTPAMQSSFNFGRDTQGINRSFSAVSNLNTDIDMLSDWLVGTDKENFYAINYNPSSSRKLFSAWGNIYSEDISITPVEDWNDDLSNQTKSIRNYKQFKAVKKGRFNGFDYLVALTRTEILILDPDTYKIIATSTISGKIVDAWNRFEVVDLDNDGDDSIIYLPTDDSRFEVIEYRPRAGKEYTEAGDFLQIFRANGPISLGSKSFIIADVIPVPGVPDKEIITNTGHVYSGSSFALRKDIEVDIAPNFAHELDCNRPEQPTCVALNNFRDAYGMIGINVNSTETAELLSLQPDGLHIYEYKEDQLVNGELVDLFVQQVVFPIVTFPSDQLPEVFTAVSVDSVSNVYTTRLFVGSNGIMHAFTITFDGSYSIFEEVSADSESNATIINLALGNIDNDAGNTVDLGYITLATTDVNGEYYPEFNVIPDIKNWDPAMMWNSRSTPIPFGSMSKISEIVSGASYCEAPMTAEFNAGNQRWEILSSVLETNADGSSSTPFPAAMSTGTLLPPNTSRFAVAELYGVAAPTVISAENIGSDVRYQEFDFNTEVLQNSELVTDMSNQALHIVDVDADTTPDVIRMQSSGSILQIDIPGLPTSGGAELGTVQTLATATYLPAGADYATIYRLASGNLYRYKADAAGVYSLGGQTKTILTSGTPTLLAEDLDGDGIEEVIVGIDATREIAIFNYLDDNNPTEIRRFSLDAERLTAMTTQALDDDDDGNPDRNLLLIGAYKDIAGLGRRCYVKAIDAEGGGLAWQSPTLVGSQVVDIQWVDDRLHVITDAAVYVSKPQN